jgi:DNA-directed RNA polymerase subunit RPC12/RpoP
MEGYQRACIGPAACDRIETGKAVYDFILDIWLRSSLSVPKRPSVWRCAYCRSTTLVESAKCLNCGASYSELDEQKGMKFLKFMGADVIAIEIPDNEVRFLNSKRPEMNHVITI